MTTPIENCPQPETPIRERALTAEQAIAMLLDRALDAAGFLSGIGRNDHAQPLRDAVHAVWPDSAKSMGAVFAIATSQQCGRVDEDADGEAIRTCDVCGDPVRYGAHHHACGAAILAAEERGRREAQAASAQDAQDSMHPDDVAVELFAGALKSKLAEARAKGRGGWANAEPGMQQRLSDMLRAHVEKGDPRDVGNFAMFLHQRGESILPAQNAQMDAVFVYPNKPKPRAWGYLDDSGVEWAGYDVSQMEAYARAAVALHVERARVPAEVAAWVEAKREHKRLVGVYKDRRAYAKQHDLGSVSVDHEYQAMCTQQRVMNALIEPMFDALAATPSQPEEPPHA